MIIIQEILLHYVYLTVLASKIGDHTQRQQSTVDTNMFFSVIDGT